MKKIEGDANYETIFPYIAPLQPRRLRFNLPVDELKIDRRLGRRTLEITYIWNSRDPSPFLSFFSPPPKRILEESNPRGCPRARLLAYRHSLAS